MDRLGDAGQLVLQSGIRMHFEMPHRALILT